MSADRDRLLPACAPAHTLITELAALPRCPLPPVTPARSDRHLSITFEAFLATHARKWLTYAYLHTGSEPAAREVALAAYEQLGRLWPHALRQASVEAYAWSVLKERVVEWLYDHQQPTALTETAAFAVVTHALLRECQQQFAMLESQLGLYAAIARLPERQCDVIVLRHVIGYSDAQIGALLGVDEVTVRSYASRGKRKLAAALGIDQGHPRGN
ncbi:sigma-70 family RNA polymerase sigma factor [Streptomyces sp. 9-7]|uniref:Sigma-70 family RNA polymerase sigma factor n=1 Tax=Streptomyces siderophoricus TaxID=2802281 RepID=A0ABS1MNI8_9ACTN|nr:sigma-70 family RNA polymerase sigma factor [Streptomyces sp. 9-7]